MNNNQIKEAVTLVGKGITLQEQENYEEARKKIQEGIESIKYILTKDNSSSNSKEIIFEYVIIHIFIFSIVCLKSFYKVLIMMKSKY